MKYFSHKCKVHPTVNLHSLIAVHDCASFSVRLLIALEHVQLGVTPFRIGLRREYANYENGLWNTLLMDIHGIKIMNNL